MANDKNELINSFKAAQDKYTYYLIALAVACLGFSINITLDYDLTNQAYPLGGAVLCWLLSIFAGLKNRAWANAATWVNIGLLEILEGTNEIAGNHPQKIQIGIEVSREIMARNGKKAMVHAGLQEWSLYIGVFFSFFGEYLLWPILT